MTILTNSLEIIQKQMSATNDAADSVSPKVFPTQTIIDVKDIPVSGEGKSVVVSPTTPSNVMRKSTVASLLTLRFVFYLLSKSKSYS